MATCVLNNKIVKICDNNDTKNYTHDFEIIISEAGENGFYRNIACIPVSFCAFGEDSERIEAINNIYAKQLTNTIFDICEADYNENIEMFRNIHSYLILKF